MIDLRKKLLEFEERLLFKEHADTMDRMLDQEDPEARDLLLRRCGFLASEIRSMMIRNEFLNNCFLFIA